MNIAFFGSSDFVLPIADALRTAGVSSENKNGLELKLIVTQPDRMNRNKVVVNPVAQWARDYSIQLWQPHKLREVESEARKVFEDIDLIIVASYGQIIPQWLLDIPQYGGINWHPSLLPAYRGPTPMQTALKNGDSISGLTWIVMTSQMDAGNIIAQYSHDITQETILSLATKMGELGGQTVIDVVNNHIESYFHNFQTRVQIESDATFTSMLTKDNRSVDPLYRTATEVWNHWRAYLMFPRTAIVDSYFGVIVFKEISQVKEPIIDPTHLKDSWYEIKHTDGKKILYKCAHQTFLEIIKIQTSEGKQIELRGYSFTP